jgi:hypothetical protein
MEQRALGGHLLVVSLITSVGWKPSDTYPLYVDQRSASVVD